MVWASVIVGVLSLIGTLAGTYAGIVSASKVTEWRIKQLETKINDVSAKVDDLSAQVHTMQGRMEVLHNG